MLPLFPGWTSGWCYRYCVSSPAHGLISLFCSWLISKWPLLPIYCLAFSELIAISTLIILGYCGAILSSWVILLMEQPCSSLMWWSWTSWGRMGQFPWAFFWVFVWDLMPASQLSLSKSNDSSYPRAMLQSMVGPPLEKRRIELRV